MLYHCPSLELCSATLLSLHLTGGLTIQTLACNFFSLLTHWKQLFIYPKSNSLLFPIRNDYCGEEKILHSPSQLRYLKINAAKHLFEFFWIGWISGWRAIREQGWEIPRMLWTLVPTRKFKMTSALQVQASLSSLCHREGSVLRSAAVMRCLLWSSLWNGLTWALLQPGFGLDKELEG